MTSSSLSTGYGRRFTMILLAAAALACGAGTDHPGAPPSSPRTPPAAEGPAITTQPQDQTVVEGQPATFAVAATCSSQLEYRWTRNGTAIEGATAASFTTAATVAGDDGAAFQVKVSCAGGTVLSTEAILTVTAPVVGPSITTAPQSQSVTTGQRATFTVVATGTAPLGYQWTRNGTSISGATAASYTTPATTAADSGAAFRVVVTNRAGTVTSSAATLTVTSGTTPTVTVTLTPSKTIAISPYVYGLNFLTSDAGNPTHLTFDRQGGNRLTAYNWENNASNAGSDWGPYSNDSYMGGGNTPDETLRSFVEADRAVGAASLVTVPMQGYVAADKDGLVDMGQPLATRLANRFKQIVFQKSAAFTLAPPTNDAYVYVDEMVWALDQKFPGQGIFGAGAALPTFVSLDNEPELWNSTHQEIQETREGADDYIEKTIALASALKARFPELKLFGPVHYGFNGIYDFQGEPGLGDSFWFTDRYLQALKTAEATYKRRLLDVYDFHWYSESYAGGTRITDLSGSTLTDTEIEKIVQSPRSLWDPTYTDSTDWISRDVLGGPIRILGRIQEKIDADYPGTKIAITEYENGGWNHIAGTVAQADNLGIFGSHGVYAAAFWPPQGSCEYALAGFRAYRDFDGAGAVFGDVSIAATSSDPSKVVVHASKDTAVAGRYVFVAVNRSRATQRVAVNGLSLSGTATTYRMTASSAASQVSAGKHVAPVLVGQASVSGNLSMELPPLSVSTIAVR